MQMMEVGALLLCPQVDFPQQSILRTERSQPVLPVLLAVHLLHQLAARQTVKVRQIVTVIAEVGVGVGAPMVAVEAQSSILVLVVPDTGVMVEVEARNIVAEVGAAAQVTVTAVVQAGVEAEAAVWNVTTVDDIALHTSGIMYTAQEVPHAEEIVIAITESGWIGTEGVRQDDTQMIVIGGIDDAST